MLAYMPTRTYIHRRVVSSTGYFNFHHKLMGDGCLLNGQGRSVDLFRHDDAGPIFDNGGPVHVDVVVGAPVEKTQGAAYAYELHNLTREHVACFCLLGDYFSSESGECEHCPIGERCGVCGIIPPPPLCLQRIPRNMQAASGAALARQSATCASTANLATSPR